MLNPSYLSNCTHEKVTACHHKQVLCVTRVEYTFVINDNYYASVGGATRHTVVVLCVCVCVSVRCRHSASHAKN